jgi:hypothetical protein
LNKLFGDFLGFLMLVSQYLDIESVFNLSWTYRRHSWYHSDWSLPKQKQVYGIWWFWRLVYPLATRYIRDR